MHRLCPLLTRVGQADLDKITRAHGAFPFTLMIGSPERQSDKDFRAGPVHAGALAPPDTNPS